MLLERGLILQDQLDLAYKAMADHPGETLARFLISVTAVTQAQIDEVSSEHTVKAEVTKPPVDAKRYEKTKVRPAPPSADLPADVRQMIKNPDYCFDKWVLLGMLGKGGMGEVWKAYQRDLKRYVAIKFLEAKEEGVDLDRFFREAQTAASLNHPNITSLFELNRHGDRYYIVMELVDGVTLQKHMGKLPFDKAAKLVRSASVALEYAHKQGIIHRDIKPANIMVSKAGRVYVMDFGLAKQTKEATGATIAGMILGTPAYMSPEQTEGKPEKLDKRTDIYSLGATLYALATGKSPASAGSVMATMQKVFAGDIPAPRTLNPKIPVELEAIILKAMDRSPARRYQTSGALGEDLRRWLDGEPISAATPSMASSLRMFFKKHRNAVLGAGVGLLVVIVALTTFLVTRGSGAPVMDGGSASSDELRKKEEDLKRRQEEIDVNRELERAQQAVLDAERVLVIEGEKWEKLVVQADLALSECTRVLTKYPKAWEAMMLQGRALALKLDYAGAEKKLRAAVEAGPHSEAAHRELGRLYWLWSEELDTGRTWTGQAASAAGDEMRQKALAPLQKFERLAMDKPDQLLAQALVEYVSRQYSAAELTAKKAIAAKANRWENHFVRAQALRRLGRAKDAWEDMETASRLQRSNPVVLLMWAGTHVHLYNRQPAIPILDSVLRLRPDFLAALCLRAQLCAEQNRAQEGLNNADAAVKAAPGKPDGYIARALAFSSLGRMDDAQKALDEAIALDAKNGRAYALRAIPRLARKDVDGALADVTKAIELDPTAPEGYSQRGRLEIAMGKIDDGLKDSAKAAELDAHYATAHVELLFGLGRLQDAIQAGMKYTEQMPNDYRLHLQIGMAQFHAGDYVGALTSLNRSQELLGMFAPTISYRGMTYYKLNKFKEAYHDLEWCWSCDRANGRPNPEIIAMVAACHFQLQRYKQTVDVFDEAFKLRPELKKLYEPMYNEAKGKLKP